MVVTFAMSKGSMSTEDCGRTLFDDGGCNTGDIGDMGEHDDNDDDDGHCVVVVVVTGCIPHNASFVSFEVTNCSFDSLMSLSLTSLFSLGGLGSFPSRLSFKKVVPASSSAELSSNNPCK